MGLFERMGRKVERLKQEVDTARRETASHRCRACGEFFHGDREPCPECGEDAVAPIEDA